MQLAPPVARARANELHGIVGAALRKLALITNCFKRRRGAVHDDVVGPRICLWIEDDDLRAWVVEELSLMTWVSPPILVSVWELPADRTGLLILDHIPQTGLEAVRSWPSPVIAIGADPGVAGALVLGPELTSRELKQAIRSTAFAGLETRKSAVV